MSFLITPSAAEHLIWLNSVSELFFIHSQFNKSKVSDDDKKEITSLIDQLITLINKANDEIISSNELLGMLEVLEQNQNVLKEKIEVNQTHKDNQILK
jgi:hypothetical protein